MQYTTKALRQAFLDFFKTKQHEVVASSSLIPGNDKTLLFTNAGMVQFKEVFLGIETKPFSRATSSQRCVRAGGKHNDLENVGYTARHHTFFEMLGNFSFGDYFKRDAIFFAWDFLTKVLAIPEEKLWVTVYNKDDEAADIWLKEVKVSERRFSRIGEKDNFWSMGDTGPCGPCTEIFYDHGDSIWGGPPGTPEEDGDRYVEIWNLVFMQYDRDKAGTLHPLPKPSVDTGMGLERLAAVMQGVHSNYDIDLFKYLIKSAAKVTNTEDLHNNSLKVIADHIRSCCFLILDGVTPSNDGRGYVLRRIIRRAIRHGYKLGCKDIFFSKLVPALQEVMGEAYPELKTKQDTIQDWLKLEEESFAKTIDNGLGLLNEIMEKLPKNGTIAGDLVFKLYDTYGFPADLTADIARERELHIDQQGFDQKMQEQKENSKKAGNFDANYKPVGQIADNISSCFEGYEHLEQQAKIIALYQDEQSVERLSAAGAIVLDHTPFYAESGGQIGDIGKIFLDNNVFLVSNTQKQGKAILHYGKMETGYLTLEQTITAQVNKDNRQAIVLNHSATHLMHSALRTVLGEHVQQKGSLVTKDRLRFDFSHFAAVTEEEQKQIEMLVNEQILQNHFAQAQEMPIDQAMQMGAMALFGEKYGDVVRVVRIGDFSTELCGGTHVKQSGDIGLFKIISESSVSSGIRRIEAITGKNALQWIYTQENLINKVSQLIKTSPYELEEKVKQLLDKQKQLEKTIDELQSKVAQQAKGDLISQAVNIEGINLLAVVVEGMDDKALGETLDYFKDKLTPAAIVLGTKVGDDKVKLFAGVSKSATDRVKAGDLVNFVAQQVGGKGGGRPDMARAGGNDPSKLAQALTNVKEWLAEKLKN